jgi:outer membrane biosynthesis protein TonB
MMQRYSLVFALFLHLFLFSGVSYTNFISLPPMLPHDMPALDIPAYVAHENEQSPSLLENSIQQTKPKEEETSPQGIEKPVVPQQLTRSTQFQEVKVGQNQEDPVHLIGDKKVSKSLIVLLGKAITAHLIYPKSAMDLNVQGISYIGFMIYPDGKVSDIKLLKTSSADVLDKAAYNAIHAIAPVKHVDTYIQKPEFIVFGIIFGDRGRS